MRHTLQARLASAGQAANGPYVVDTGFEGATNHQAWATQYQVQVTGPPCRTSDRP
jgi:hypothetical protein